MYNIKTIPHDNWRKHAETQEFYSNLAKNPYCSSGKDADGNLYAMLDTKANAIKQPLIQANPPHEKHYIVIDLDDTDALHKTLKESEVPPPHLIICNPKNGHAHLVYKLAMPVFTWGNVSQHAIRYLAKVEKGLRYALGGDAGYSGNLMKNPASKEWRTYSVTTAPKEGYTLNFLEQELIQLINFTAVHNSVKTARPLNDMGFARNCNLFDRTRVIAYGLGGGSQRELFKKILPIAQELNNTFDEPLFFNEVTYIARSIAKYCSRKNFTESHKRFSDKQSRIASYRWGDNTEKKQQAQIWASEGVSFKVISERLGINPRTLTRWGIEKNKK